MKCPVCVREGTTSTVRQDVHPATTLMAHQPWWDESGQWHDHDPNGLGAGYVCSLGHGWWASWQQRCPAGDYGGEVTITERKMVRVEQKAWRLDASGAVVEADPYVGWRDAE